MSFTLVNASLAGLLALAVVPLLLHLFARSKPPVYEFSSVEFLRRIIRKTMRMRKPQDYLLLVLRTLVFLALIGAFLRPLWFAQEKLSGLFQKKNLVVIVDASASMSLVEGAQTRFAQACAEAGELLGGLTSRDAANVVWLDAQPEAVFPDGLAINLGFLRDQLRRARVSSERGAPGKALQLALQLLEETEGTREICIVSDFQRQGWESFEPAIPDDVELIQVKIGDGGVPNLAVARLRYDPPDPVVGEDLTIYAEVRNFSDEATQTTVFSEAGESRRSQNLSIEPWETATAIFHHSVSAAGVLPVSASVAEDAYPGDDSRHQVLVARPYLRIGVWNDGSPLGTNTARVWTRAAQSLGWAVPETLDTPGLANAAFTDYDAILLAGWNDAVKGLSVPVTTKLICQPSPDLDTAALASLLGIDEKPGGKEIHLENRDKKNGAPFQLMVTAPEDNLFSLFRGGEFGDPGGPAGFSRLAIDGASFPKAVALLSWKNDDFPALARVTNHRYLWTIPVAEKAGNWAGRIEFLPLFAELLLADRGHSQGDTPSDAVEQLDTEPGESILWTAPDEVEIDKLSLIPPGEGSLEFRLESARRFLTGPTEKAGLYVWKAEDAPIGFSAVNFPTDAESDLRTLTREEVESSASAVVVSGGNQVRHLRDGLKLWPWLLAAAVGLLLGESLVMWWAARTV